MPAWVYVYHIGTGQRSKEDHRRPGTSNSDSLPEKSALWALSHGSGPTVCLSLFHPDFLRSMTIQKPGNLPASLVISVHMVGKLHLYNMESYEMWSMEACSFHNKRFYFILLYVPTGSFWMRSPTKKTKYSQMKIPNASPLCFRTIISWGIPTRWGERGRLTFNCALSADEVLFTTTSIWPNSKIRTEILTFHVSTETRSTPQGTMWRLGAHSKWILMEVVSLETQALTPGLLLWKHVILQMVQSNSLHLNLIDVFYVYLHCRRLRHTWVCLFFSKALSGEISDKCPTSSTGLQSSVMPDKCGAEHRN